MFRHTRKSFFCILLCAVLLFSISDFFKLPANAAGSVTPAVSVGNGFVVTLDSTGKAYAWGSNTDGTLGNGTNTATNYATAVTMPEQVYFKSISAGFNHVLAIANDGSVYAWGANESGQLGLNGNSAVTAPTKVTALEGKRVIAVSAGKQYSLALTENGEVYAWGINNKGQLGKGISESTNAPARIEALATTFVTQICAGPMHAGVITSDGRVLLWGDNAYIKLGVENVTTSTPIRPESSTMPAITKEMALGENHSTFLFATTFTDSKKDTSNVGSFGYNKYGQFANNATTTNGSYILKPALLGTLSVEQIATSSNQTVLLTTDGMIYTAGLQIGGDGSTTQITATALPLSAYGLTATAIDAAYDNGAAIAMDGSVWVWGDNTNGQLGNKTFSANTEPVCVLRSDDTMHTIGSSPLVQTFYMRFNAAVPAPTYSVTIPSQISVGDLYQKGEDDADRYSDTSFSITATNVQNLFGEKQIVVKLSTPDTKFELYDSASGLLLPYSIYAQSDPRNPIASGDTVAVFTENAIQDYTIRVDQSLISKSGNYSDTINFHITLEEITE